MISWGYFPLWLKVIASILKFLWGNFDSCDFLRLNCPNVRNHMSYRSMYNIYLVNLKLATTYQKNVLGFFDFHLWLSRAKCTRCMHEDPFFFEPSILNIHTKQDIIAIEQRYLAFNYGRIRNPESGNGEEEENDGMLVLRKSLLNIRRYGPCKCNNRGKYTDRKLHYSSYNYNSGLLYSVSRKYLSGRPI